MAEQAVKKEIKTTPIKYKRNDIDEDAILQKLVEERDSSLKKEADAEEDKQETESLNPEEKTFKKRYGDLRRHSQQKEDDYKKQILSLREQLATTTKENIQLPKTEQELADWTSKYPDVAQVIETIATKKARELDASIEDRMKIIAEKEALANRSRAEVELLKAHPDFEEIRNNQDFHDWVEEQPKWIVNALYENDTDAKAAARAIDLYKADKGVIAKEKPKQDTKSAAHAVSRGVPSNPAPTKQTQANQKLESQVAKMSAQQYEKNESAIMEAIKSGNFIYDITRPNS